MNLLQFDNVLKDPEKYLEEIFKYEFQETETGQATFKNIQQRDDKDEFSEFMLSMFPGYKVNLNFIMNEASSQIPLDVDSSDITCFLYLDKDAPKDYLSQGTLFIDDEDHLLLSTLNKFNRMVAFSSKSATFINKVNLVQILFLKAI